MEVLLLAVMALSNIFCFMIGAKVGQSVVKGEEVKLPSVNPLKVYREHESRKEAEREMGKLDTILHNIENYDGTPNNQKDVPRG